MTAFLHVAPLSVLTSTLEIPLDPAKAMPPTETCLLDDVPAAVEVLLLPEPEIVVLAGRNPLNLVLSGALPGMTMDDRALITAVLLQPLRCQKPS